MFKVRKSFGLTQLLFIGFLISLAGCSRQPAVNPQEKATITVWHWMTDREPALQELARRYEEKSGVKVNFELYAPSDAYAQKVRTAAQGGSLPDIFSILGEKVDFASFIKAGYILDLTPYMEENNGEWKNEFFAKALAVNEFSPSNKYGVNAGFYGVPIDIMTIKMLYNKDLFRKLGLNPDMPPVTFTEFLEIGRKAKQAQIQGLVSGWGEAWMIGCLANNYAFNIMGETKVLATIRGEVPYTDPDWIKVLGLFKEMQDSGLLASGVVTMVNKTAEQLFANGRAVFAFNGSWCVNVYKAMNPNLEYAAMLPPAASDKFPVSIWGGAGSSFMVNAKSEKKEEAVKFLKWLTDLDQQAYLAQMTSNLPANKYALSKVSAILGQLAGDMERATHPNIWDISESPRVLEIFNKGIQSIIIGEKTPEQVAEETQRMKEKEMARKSG
ncbi:MAG TPA: extracellular solute-binding protein [Candidatus Margulisiibacteriota bacterium]|nr:extracellular solute-binding protein [Candidatus Margulisiibacteriota bacterium]